MKNIFKKSAILLALMMVVIFSTNLGQVEAAKDEKAAVEQVQEKEDKSESQVLSSKAKASGFAIGIAALGAAIGMGLAIAKSTDAISRQPEAESKIRTTLMLGLVFIETVVIYALIIAILIIFVL